MDTFNFAPNSTVPELLPPDPVQGISMNGWHFSAKPTVPFQPIYKLTLHGMRWCLQPNGHFDASVNPATNARRLELFYQSHLTWNPFLWTHPHIGELTVRFAQALVIPAAIPNSNGLIEAFEVHLVEHNPGYV